MDKDELYKIIFERLTRVENELRFLKDAVIEYADHNEPLNVYDMDGGELERKLDGLGFVNGWVIDRLKHINLNSKRSLTHKIRKAQGYNV